MTGETGSLFSFFHFQRRRQKFAALFVDSALVCWSPVVYTKFLSTVAAILQGTRIQFAETKIKLEQIETKTVKPPEQKQSRNGQTFWKKFTAGGSRTGTSCKNADRSVRRPRKVRKGKRTIKPRKNAGIRDLKASLGRKRAVL